MNNVMINAKETVKKDIFEIQMDGNTRKAAKDIGSALGPIAAAAAKATQGKKKSTSKGTSK